MPSHTNLICHSGTRYARTQSARTTRRTSTKLPASYIRLLESSAKSATILDDLNIPKYARIAAGLGSKFAYPGKPRIEPEDIIGILTAIMQIGECITNPRQRTQIMQQMRRVLHKFRTKNYQPIAKRLRDNPITASLMNIHKQTKRFLGNNAHIIITEGDKGNHGVICLRSTMITKISEHVNTCIGDGTYNRVPLARMQTNEGLRNMIFLRAEDKYRELILQMNPYFTGEIRQSTMWDAINAGNGDRRTDLGQHYEIQLPHARTHIVGDCALGFTTPRYGRLLPEAYAMARLYISIKIHKGPHYPTRPIIAAPVVCGSILESWLLGQLGHLVAIPPTEEPNTLDLTWIKEFRFIASNTDTVIKGIRKFGLKPGHRIISLDFVSMYTNVDRELVFKYIEENYHIIGRHTSMPKRLFIDALKHIMLHNGFFTAGGNIYTQKKGLPMGGKLSKVCSEIVTAHGTILALEEAMAGPFQFSFIYKYVDDFLVGVNSSSTGTTPGALGKLLEKHIPGMSVTFEEEKLENGLFTLKYLEFTTIRTSIDDTNVSTIWSRQKYASSRLTNEFNDVQARLKHNTIKEILRKALRYSTDNMKDIAFEQATNWIWLNGYSHATIIALAKSTSEYCDWMASKVVLSDSGNANVNAADISATAPDRTDRSRKYVSCELCSHKWRVRYSVTTVDRCLNAVCPRYQQFDTIVVANQSPSPPTTQSSSNTDTAVRIGPHATNLSPRSQRTAEVHQDGLPKYISIPSIKGLEKGLNAVLKSWNIPVKMTPAAQRNHLFESIKDEAAVAQSSMVTYTARCSECDRHTMSNAIDSTVGRCLQRSSLTSNNNHTCTWVDVRILAKHPTRKRAAIGLRMLQEISALNPDQLSADSEHAEIAKIL